MSVTNRYDPTNPNHKVACTRTKCAELDRAPHPSGVHLDQRHEFYDGPQTQMAATSMYIRDSARKIIRNAPELMPEVVDLVTYVGFLSDQTTHARVDRDRGIREAGAKALDCEAHGEVIKGLQDQVHAFGKSAERSEAGRLVALGFLHAVDQVLERAEWVLPETLDQLLAALASASRKTHAAHDRAWKRG
jgi:hypothetical protein